MFVKRTYTLHLWLILSQEDLVIIFIQFIISVLKIMFEFIETLWICPICSAEHAQPVINCTRCDCKLLLLNKIKLIAYHFEQKGYKELSRRYYDHEIDVME